MKPGLYANIHAKRKRIKAGSGEKMRQVGSQGAPTQQSFIDSAKTAKRAGGGMMDIYGMTAPLGYALGGPAGMTEPERKSAQPITIEQIIREAEASKAPTPTRPPIKKVIENRMPVDPYHVLTDKEFKRKDPIEMLQAVSGKGLDALKRLAEETIGAGPAEGSESYLGKEEIIKMETDDLLGELKSMGASHEDPLFPTIANRPGNKWKTYNTMKLILDELMSRLDLD